MTGDELPNNVLDAAAMSYIRLGFKGSLPEARDLVILRCLERGSLIAFSHWVLEGHQPGPEVIRFLAYMARKEVPGVIEKATPFRLVTRLRKAPGRGGMRDNPLNDLRDEILALNVAARIEEHSNYDAAIMEIAEMISDGKVGKGGSPLKHQMERDAYDKFSTRLNSRNSS